MLFITLLILLLLLIIPVFFYNQNRENEHFTTPTPVNIPTGYKTKGKPFFVGSSELGKYFETTPTGKYNFRKQELLYDGVWGRNDEYNNENKTMECNWNVRSSYYPLDLKQDNLVYGANEFWKRPLKKLGLNEKIISSPDCGWKTKIGNNSNLTYLDSFLMKQPCYLNKPTTEDILGYYPRNNRNVEINTPVLGRI